MITSFRIFESSFLIKNKNLDIKDWNIILKEIPSKDELIDDLLVDISDEYKVSKTKNIVVNDMIVSDRGQLKSELLINFPKQIYSGWIISIETPKNKDLRPQKANRIGNGIPSKEFINHGKLLIDLIGRFEYYFDVDVLYGYYGGSMTIILIDRSDPINTNDVLKPGIGFEDPRKMFINRIDKYLSKICDIKDDTKNSGLIILEPKSDKYSLDMIENIIQKMNHKTLTNIRIYKSHPSNEISIEIKNKYPK